MSTGPGLMTVSVSCFHWGNEIATGESLQNEKLQIIFGIQPQLLPAGMTYPAQSFDIALENIGGIRKCCHSTVDTFFAQKMQGRER